MSEKCGKGIGNITSLFRIAVLSVFLVIGVWTVAEKMVRPAEAQHPKLARSRLLFGCFQAMDVKFVPVSFPDWSLEVKIRTNGGPVFVGLEKAFLSGGGELRICRGDVVVAETSWGFRGNRPASLWGIDTPPKGSHVYKIKMRTNPESRWATLNNGRLVAFEL